MDQESNNANMYHYDDVSTDYDAPGNVYIDIKDDNCNYDNVENSHVYTELDLKTRDTPNTEVFRTDTTKAGITQGIYLKKWHIILILIASTLLIFTVAFVSGLFAGRHSAVNYDKCVGEDDAQGQNMTTTTTTRPTTTVTITTTATTAECSTRYDIIIITDEWNVPLTYTLMSEFANQIYDNNRNMRLGLITQSTRPSLPFNITLTSPQDFLEASAPHQTQFCCAKVSDLIHQAVELFSAKRRRANVKNVILFVSLYNFLYRDTIDNIKVAADDALDNNIHRIVSAGFNLHSADNTREEVYAVTSEEHIYAFSSTNQTQTARIIYENSFC